MLEQQGLDDIAQASATEQIAYLLVERARLLDELEAEQTRNCVETSEGPMTAEQLLVRQRSHVVIATHVFIALVFPGNS